MKGLGVAAVRVGGSMRSDEGEKQSASRRVSAVKPWEDLSLPAATRFGNFKRGIKDELAQLEREVQRNVVDYNAPALRNLFGQSKMGALLADAGWALKIRSADDFAYLYEKRAAYSARQRLELLKGANKILCDYRLDRDGLHALRIPRGVSDLDALKMLDLLLIERAPQLGHEAIDASAIGWLRRSAAVQHRDLSRPRDIRLVLMVPGTEGKDRDRQERIVEKAGMVFAQPIEQALVIAAALCARDGQNPIRGVALRGAGYTGAMTNLPIGPLMVHPRYPERDQYAAGASGVIPK